MKDRFYKDYPKEFYLINNLVSHIKSEVSGLKQIFVTTYDFTNRCLNYYAIDDKCKNFDNNKATNIKNFLNEIKNDEMEIFFNTYFSHERFNNTKEYFLNKKWESSSEDEFHYHLAEIYHFFPIDPNKYIDGALKLYVWKKVGFDYALVETNDPYYPWVKLYTSKNCWCWVNQETLKVSQTNPKNESSQQKQPNWEPKIFWKYLFNIFIDPKFSATGYKEPGNEPYKFMIFPVFDAGIPFEGWGNLLCHIYLLFENETTTNNEKINEQIWHRFGSRIAEIAFEARRHELISLPIRYTDDILKDLLWKISFIQNWQRIAVLRKSNSSSSYEIKYCFKRFGGGEKNKLEYETGWDICEKNNNCLNCFQLQKLKNNQSQENYLLKLNNKYFYVQKLDKILDQRILPSIDDREIINYQETILCFEFPKDTFLPNNRDEKIKLGEHYFNKLIPIFEQLLLKKKVLNHGIKSAVSAIVSRNHSHHIGSHVTPRTTVDKIEEKLKKLYDGLSDEDIKNAISYLKDRLDEYIQKKADFLAEISTEPLQTTTSKLLFGEVMSYFIQNTLLMDNIATNEGIEYSKTNGNIENRLKIHLLRNGQEVLIKYEVIKEYNNLTLPYLRKPAEPKGLVSRENNGVSDDISIAWPGPLGEFALYSFLENFIRNAAKHNYDSNEGIKELNIFMDIMDEKCPDKDHFYKIRIWDDLSNPNKIKDNKELWKWLDEKVKQNIIENDGQLIKSFWGLSEMKIMATLLKGSSDFLSMGRNLIIKSEKKDGKERLIFEFNLMKPKNVAIIEKVNGDKKEKDKQEGIWWFDSFEDYKRHFNSSISQSNFDVIVINKKDLKKIEGYEHILPYRILVDGNSKKNQNSEKNTGMIRVNSIIKSIKKLEPKEIAKTIWQEWIKGLKKRYGLNDEMFLTIFLGQDKQESPTEKWLNLVNTFNGTQQNPLKLAVIYRGESNNEISPKINYGNKKILIFDRHLDGFKNIWGKNNKPEATFFEVIDKNSSDFNAIYFSEVSDINILKLAESALLRILIVDERVAEVAFEKIISSVAGKEQGIFESRKRIEVAKRANIFIATHIQIEGEGSYPLHKKVKDKSQKIFLRIIYKKQNNKDGIINLNVCYCKDSNGKALKPDILVLHQGVAESILKNVIEKYDGKDFKNKFRMFIKEVEKSIPFVIIESGRGIPPNLPENIKFMPFSLIQEYIMKDMISKHCLSRIIMSITRGGNQ